MEMQILDINMYKAVIQYKTNLINISLSFFQKNVHNYSTEHKDNHKVLPSPNQ